jgi:hypothetical protein
MHDLLSKQARITSLAIGEKGVDPLNITHRRGKMRRSPQVHINGGSMTLAILVKASKRNLDSHRVTILESGKLSDPLGT